MYPLSTTTKGQRARAPSPVVRNMGGPPPPRERNARAPSPLPVQQNLKRGAPALPEERGNSKNCRNNPRDSAGAALASLADAYTLKQTANANEPSMNQVMMMNMQMQQQSQEQARQLQQQQFKMMLMFMMNNSQNRNNNNNMQNSNDNYQNNNMNNTPYNNMNESQLNSTNESLNIRRMDHLHQYTNSYQRRYAHDNSGLNLNNSSTFGFPNLSSSVSASSSAFNDEYAEDEF